MKSWTSSRNGSFLVAFSVGVGVTKLAGSLLFATSLPFVREGSHSGGPQVDCLGEFRALHAVWI